MPYYAGQKTRASDLNAGQAYYYQSVAQTNIADSTPTIVTYDVGLFTTADVTYDNTTGLFTVKRAGWWRVEASYALNSDGSPGGIGERLLSLLYNPTTVTAGAKPTYTGGTPFDRDSDHVATAFAFMSVSKSRKFAVNDQIFVSINVNTTASTLDSYVSGEQSSIALTWSPSST